MTAGSVGGEIGAVGGQLRGFGIPTPQLGYLERLLALNPLVAWDFSEAEATSFPDITGNGRTGILSGTGTAGQEGPVDILAISLAAGSSVKASDLILNDTTKTFVSWVKIDADYGDAHTLFGLSVGDGGADSMVVVSDAGFFVVTGQPDSLYTRQASARYQKGRWHFVAITFDDDAWKVYLDTFLAGSWTVSTTRTNYTTPNVTLNPATWVGANAATYAGFAAFDRVLESSEIAQLYGAEPYVPSAYAQTVLADDPILLWPFDDEPGSLLVRDISQVGIFGEYVGTVEHLIPGVDGRASIQTGAGGCAVVGHAGGQDARLNTRAASLEIVFRRVATNDYSTLWSLGTGHMSLRLNSSGAFEALRTNVVLLGTSDVSITDDEWHHAVFTGDGVSSGVVYLDGERILSLTSPHFEWMESTWPDSVGASYSYSPEYGIPTGFQYAAAYDYALSDAQVAEHFEALDLPAGS